MKLLIFLHGTVIMHKNANYTSRKERVKQSVNEDPSVLDYENYIPIENSVKKLKTWERQGTTIIYLSSHENLKDVKKDKYVLKKYGFPSGKIVFRRKGEQYKNIAEKIIPDILIEDD